MANITVEMLKALREDFNEALVVIGKKHGITISAGNANCTRDGKIGQFKLDLVNAELSVDGATARDVKMEASLSRAKIMYPDLDLSATYKSPRLGALTIVGYNSRAREYPFIVKTASGDKYKMAPEQLRRLVTV